MGSYGNTALIVNLVNNDFWRLPWVNRFREKEPDDLTFWGVDFLPRDHDEVTSCRLTRKRNPLHRIVIRNRHPIQTYLFGSAN
jgi:hypothetical protein